MQKVTTSWFCPACHIALAPEKLDDLKLWKCEACAGFAMSVPIVRKEIQSQHFKDIWGQLFAGDYISGRPCPGCKKPLCEVKAQGSGRIMEIDVCRTCQIVWFDDKEFTDLPKVAPAAARPDPSESRLLSPEDLAVKAFKEDHSRNRSLLFKLMDGSISRKYELDRFFGDFFDE